MWQIKILTGLPLGFNTLTGTCPMVLVRLTICWLSLTLGFCFWWHPTAALQDQFNEGRNDCLPCLFFTSLPAIERSLSYIKTPIPMISGSPFTSVLLSVNTKTHLYEVWFPSTLCQPLDILQPESLGYVQQWVRLRWRIREAFQNAPWIMIYWRFCLLTWCLGVLMCKKTQLYLDSICLQWYFC